MMAHTRTNLLIFQSNSMRPRDGVRLTFCIAVPRGGRPRAGGVLPPRSLLATMHYHYSSLLLGFLCGGRGDERCSSFSATMRMSSSPSSRAAMSSWYASNFPLRHHSR